AERLGRMIEDSRAAIVLTQNRLKGRMPASWAQVVCIDGEEGIWEESIANPEIMIWPNCLAYVIYTSGSSGRPKGVGIEHKQLVNYVKGMEERLGLEAGWRMALVSAITADLGYTMLYPALCLGGELHVVSEECGRDGSKWEEYQDERQIDC